MSTRAIKGMPPPDNTVEKYTAPVRCHPDETIDVDGAHVHKGKKRTTVAGDHILDLIRGGMIHLYCFSFLVIN